MNVKLITLLFLLCTSYQVTATLATYYVSAGNFDEDFAEIASKHQDDFEMDDSKGIGVEGVETYLRTLLDLELTNDEIEAPRMCVGKNVDSTLYMNIDGEFETFHFSYLKFSNGANLSIPSSNSTIIVTIENSWHSTLLALYGTSEGMRSGLFIIIIDKDMALCNSACPPTQRFGPRSEEYADEATKAGKIALKSFPNPSFDQTRLSFQLKNPERVSLQIVSPSTGKIIAQKLNQYYLTEGDHQYDFDLQALPAGIYLIVLKTGAHQQSIPIIKLE